MKITAHFVCEVPNVLIDGSPMTVSRDGEVPCLPRPGDLIYTDSNRTPLVDAEPGIEVLASVFDIHRGSVTVYCRHIAGDSISALDLINLDGWNVDCDDDRVAYIEECERLSKEGR